MSKLKSNDSRQSVIHNDIRSGRIEEIRFLLESLEEVNESYSLFGGSTPLHIAAEYGSLDIINYLLDIGAYINAWTPGGKTPLSFACDAGHIDAVKLLIQRGANTFENDKEDVLPPLHTSLICGYISIAELLLKEGKVDINICDSTGSTALHTCIIHKKTNSVEFLIENGVDVNKVDNLGNTPLLKASSIGTTEIMNMLIAAGARVNQKNDISETPVFRAIQYNRFDAVKILVKHGADLNIVTRNGCSSLRTALRFENEEIARFLICNDADVNIADNRGNTILHNVAPSVRDVKLLIEGGAEIYKLNNENKWPRDKTKNTEAIGLLDHYRPSPCDNPNLSKNRKRRMRAVYILAKRPKLADKGFASDVASEIIKHM